MVKVTFIEFDKTEHSIDADNGMSLMEVAIQNGVPELMLTVEAHVHVQLAMFMLIKIGLKKPERLNKWSKICLTLLLM